MTPSGIEPSKKTEALRPLPVLPVLRADYCSQSVTNAAIDYLTAHNPDLLERIVHEENTPRTADYFNLCFEAVEYLQDEGVDLPDDYTGKTDFLFELSRRLRKAYGLQDLLPRGKQLPQPLPPLPDIPLSDSVKKRGAVTQELCDKVLHKVYDERPDLWFALSEEYRHSLSLDASDEFTGLLELALMNDFKVERPSWVAGEIYLEAVWRIRRMCGIED